MSDGEFWEHVLQRDAHPLNEPDDIDVADTSAFIDQATCPVCGEFGACMYDAEERPLIHADGLRSEG